MRLATTQARAHGKDKFQLIHGLEVPIAKQRLAFKALKVKGDVHESFAECVLLEEGTHKRVIRFISPAEKKARDEAHEKALAETKSKQEEAEAQRKKDAEDKRTQIDKENQERLAADKKAREEELKKKGITP